MSVWGMGVGMARLVFCGSVYIKERVFGVKLHE